MEIVLYADLHSTGSGCQYMHRSLIIMHSSDLLWFYLSAAVFLSAEGVVWGGGTGWTARGARGRAGEEKRTVKRTSGETEAFSEEGPKNVPPCGTGAPGAARAPGDGGETRRTSHQCHFSPTQPFTPQIHTRTVSSNTHTHTFTRTQTDCGAVFKSNIFTFFCFVLFFPQFLANN